MLTAVLSFDGDEGDTSGVDVRVSLITRRRRARGGLLYSLEFLGKPGVV